MNRYNFIIAHVSYLKTQLQDKTYIKLTKTTWRMHESNFTGIFYDLISQNFSRFVISVINANLYEN